MSDVDATAVTTVLLPPKGHFELEWRPTICNQFSSCPLSFRWRELRWYSSDALVSNSFLMLLVTTSKALVTSSDALVSNAWPETLPHC